VGLTETTLQRCDVHSQRRGFYELGFIYFYSIISSHSHRSDIAKMSDIAANYKYRLTASRMTIAQ